MQTWILRRVEGLQSVCTPSNSHARGPSLAKHGWPPPSETREASRPPAQPSPFLDDRAETGSNVTLPRC